MPIIEGMRTDSPHGYKYTPYAKRFFPEQQKALQEMEEKQAKISQDKKYRHMADLYWATFEVMTEIEGKSDGDGYRGACDVIARYMTQQEMDDIEFHEILEVRKP